MKIAGASAAITTSALMGAAAVLWPVATLQLSKPERVPFAVGTVTARPVKDAGRLAGFLVEGTPAKYLGQVQTVGVRIDIERRIVYVDRLAVRWHPLSDASARADLPVFIPLAELAPGIWTVRYATRDSSYCVAATVTVPIDAHRAAPAHRVLARHVSGSTGRCAAGTRGGRG